MASPIKIKRSSVAGKVPTTSDLDLGELGVNTNDGKLFLKKDDGTAAIVEVGAGGSGTATQITVADETSDTSCFPVFVTNGGTQPPKCDFTNFQYNSSTGNLTATSFTGSASGLTGIQLTTADETSDTTCFPVFVTDGGTQDPKCDYSNFSYNSSTGNLTATKFTGDGSGLTNLPGGGGATDLSYTDATRVIASSTGTDATLPLMSSGNAGLVPASGGGTANFLRADGTFAAPSGGGGGSAISSAVYTGPAAATTVDSESYSTLDIDTAVGSTTGFSNTNGLVTLGAAGTYLAMCTIVVNGDGAGTFRWTGELEVRQNATTLGSVQGGYIRNAGGSEETYLSISRVITTTNSTSTVDFRVKKVGGSSESASLVQDLCTIQIIKLDGAVGPAGPSDIPQNSQTSAYTLVAGDSGKHINITTGGVTVPSGVFSAGNAITIYNDSGSSQTITQGSSVTLRLAGSASTGNRALAQYGLCSALCVANNEFVISGAGLS